VAEVAFAADALDPPGVAGGATPLPDGEQDAPATVTEASTASARRNVFLIIHDENGIRGTDSG
jgi:hypothetical protein